MNEQQKEEFIRNLYVETCIQNPYYGPDGLKSEFSNLAKVLVAAVNKPHPGITDSELRDGFIKCFRESEFSQAQHEVNYRLNAEIANAANRFIEFVEKAEETNVESAAVVPQTPFNAERILHLLLKEDERDAVIGDLVERYEQEIERVGKRRADFWFYKQIACSMWPLLRRAVAKVGAIVWLTQLLR